MAPFPEVRLKQPLRSFSKVSVDYGGPFITIQGRGRKRAKRYLCLFTCLLSRAVHLEMAYSLDTDSFLNAFYRMTSRRGLPQEVMSDNGTNFVGANTELKELISKLDKSKIEKSAANNGIKWHFNPSLGPHFGGVHETMIKAGKRAIYGILSKADITDDELSTAFTGAENLINSRPLTYQTADVEDDIPLTPNHFLYDLVGGQFALDSVDAESYNLKKRCRRVQELVKHFWGRLMKEWLPGLNKRLKWFKMEKDFKVGDIVLVLSTESKPGKQILGRISDVLSGKDNHVHIAKVQIGDQIYIRPISKLCSLECKTLRGLINQSLSKKGRMIIRKYKTMKFYINGLTKQTKFQEHSRIKDSVEKYA